METNWAAENLQVIRTLMERSALYRRALAPLMLFSGAMGLAGGILGYALNIQAPQSFLIFWSLIGVSALLGSLLLVRKQAIKDSEPFWSAPTRHVSQAVTPPLFAGALAGLTFYLYAEQTGLSKVNPLLLPSIWMVLYGCALTAASFFMRRGIRVLGWIFLLGGCLGSGLALTGKLTSDPLYGHLLMGGSFGLLHVACGVYLYYTESSRDSA